MGEEDIPRENQLNQSPRPSGGAPTQGGRTSAMKLPELKYVLNFHTEVVISSDARRPPLEIAPEPEPNYFNDDV